MKKNYDVVVIGAGVMGTMIAERMGKNGYAGKIALCARSRKAADDLIAKKKVGREVAVVAGNDAAFSAKIIILAVKPANLPEIYLELGGKLPEETIVVSIAAGETAESLAAGLSRDKIVRCMPNISARFGEAVTVWMPRGLSAEEEETARSVLALWGMEYRVSKDADVDKATALFGTGPAIIYYILEAISESGMLVGFPKGQLSQLSIQMVKGAAIAAQSRDGTHLAQLRDDISSTGGTTVEAIKTLDEYRVRAAIKEAGVAAYEKSQRLSPTVKTDERGRKKG